MDCRSGGPRVRAVLVGPGVHQGAMPRAPYHLVDGLREPWLANYQPSRVWLNPPYGRTIGAWMRKARHEVEDGSGVDCGCRAGTGSSGCAMVAVEHHACVPEAVSAILAAAYSLPQSGCAVRQRDGGLWSPTAMGTTWNGRQAVRYARTSRPGTACSGRTTRIPSTVRQRANRNAGAHRYLQRPPWCYRWRCPAVTRQLGAGGNDPHCLTDLLCPPDRPTIQGLCIRVQSRYTTKPPAVSATSGLLSQHQPVIGASPVTTLPNPPSRFPTDRGKSAVALVASEAHSTTRSSISKAPRHRLVPSTSNEGAFYVTVSNSTAAPALTAAGALTKVCKHRIAPQTPVYVLESG